MQTFSIKWLLLFFLIPKPGESHKLWKSNHFSFIERITRIILESCCENDNLSNPIVIFGDFNELIDKSSIIRMNNSSKIKKEGSFDFKASRVVIIEDSSRKLRSDLMVLRKTKWWDHMAAFFIIGKSKDACKNFTDIMIITSRMEMINSIYICAESMNTPLLYTVNPLANYAPYPWKRLGTSKYLNIFYQVFDPNVSCHNLNYDKTKFLMGHQIRALGWVPPGGAYKLGANYFEALSNYPEIKARVLESTIRAMNATCRLELHPGKNSTIKRLSNGESDIMYSLIRIEEYPERSFLFPYYWGKMVAVVKSNAEESTLHKILHLWSPPVLISAFIALAIFFAILAVKNHDCSSAMLDITRLLTYVSIRTDSRSNSFRIYFTTILILMIISNGVFQGKIAAFLTKRERMKVADSIDELMNLEYKFFTYSELETLVNFKCPKCHAKVVSINACIDYVLNDTANACLAEELIYQMNYTSFPVENVKKSISGIVGNVKCRDNWPLYRRANYMLMSIVESGLNDYWIMKQTYQPIQKRRANDTELSSPDYRPVKLSKLKFAFELLAMGLALATIVFFLEVSEAT